jgi:hypothetical protein
MADDTLVDYLNWVIVIFAFLAAAFWLWSSTQRLPKKITSGWGGSGGSAQELADKLRRQSALSAIGALFAAIAAFFQGLALALTMS